MSNTYTFGYPTTSWTSDDKNSTQESKQNGQSKAQGAIQGATKSLGFPVSDKKDEVHIAKIYKTLKMIDLPIN